MAVEFEKVAEMVRKQLKTKATEDVVITPTTRIQEDLGADSLDGVELTMQAETEFNVEISDDVANTIKTVGDLHTVINGGKVASAA